MAAGPHLGAGRDGEELVATLHVNTSYFPLLSHAY